MIPILFAKTFLKKKNVLTKNFVGICPTGPFMFFTKNLLGHSVIAILAILTSLAMKKSAVDKKLWPKQNHRSNYGYFLWILPSFETPGRALPYIFGINATRKMRLPTVLIQKLTFVSPLPILTNNTKSHMRQGNLYDFWNSILKK